MIYNNENFPSLPNTWVKIPVELACENISVREKIQLKQYKSIGQLAIIDQSGNFVGGYTDDNSKSVTDKLPVIVFGDHTRIVKFIDFLFAAGADGIKVLKPKDIFFPKLFFRFLQAVKLPDKGYARHYQYLRASYIATPPLNEQKRIADKLDKILSRVDACRERLDRIPTILKHFRRTVLVAAVTGKLTEDVRNEMQYKATEFGWEMPNSWDLVSINEVAEVKGGKRLPKGEALVAKDTGFPYIRAGQLKNGTVHHDEQLYLTADVQSQIKRYIVSSGDVYITIVGACIGDAGIIPSTYDGANLTENAAKLCNLKDSVSNVFLSFWLRSQLLQDIIQLEIKSGAQGKLALMRIKTLPFPRPSIDEQHEIVRRVEELFAYADRIEARYQAARTKVNKLTPAILAKAFRGELVPQNPDDEPASVLLERIQASRAENKVTPKQKCSRNKAVKTPTSHK